MRLLSRIEVKDKLNNDRKREIDEGAKLARRIDVLRETASREEANLMKFRAESLNLIKNDINEQITKKTNLENINKQLEDERIRLNSPLDLVEKWDRVKSDENKVVEIKKDLDERELEVISKEVTIEATNKEFFKRDELVKEKENLAHRFVEETQQKYEEAEKITQQAKLNKQETDKRIREKEEQLREKEQGLSIREKEVKLVKDQLLKDQTDVEREKIHIASQQETLRQAWNSIRKLTK